jgi:hypothetical protein
VRTALEAETNAGGVGLGEHPRVRARIPAPAATCSALTTAFSSSAAFVYPGNTWGFGAWRRSGEETKRLPRGRPRAGGLLLGGARASRWPQACTPARWPQQRLHGTGRCRAWRQAKAVAGLTGAMRARMVKALAICTCSPELRQALNVLSIFWCHAYTRPRYHCRAHEQGRQARCSHAGSDRQLRAMHGKRPAACS